MTYCPINVWCALLSGHSGQCLTQIERDHGQTETRENKLIRRVQELESKLGERAEIERKLLEQLAVADAYSTRLEKQLEEQECRLGVYKTALEQIVRRDYTGASYVALEALRDAERVVEIPVRVVPLDPFPLCLVCGTWHDPNGKHIVTGYPETSPE